MSELFINQENPEHNIIIDTNDAVIFDDQTDAEALVSQEQQRPPGYRESSLDEPAAVLTLGILATVAIVPAYLHARHDRMRREQEEHDTDKE